MAKREKSDSASVKAFELMRAGRLEEAIALMSGEVRGARICLPAHGFLASLLLKSGRGADAGTVVASALALGTGEADAYDGLAYACMALGRHDEANALYRRATEIRPELPRFWYNLASSERSLGRLIEAEAACDRAIAIDPSQYATYLLRSELRVQSQESNHVSELKRLLTQPQPHHARVFFGYSLGKELDDLGCFDEAFRWFSYAASARRSRLSYDVAADERKLKRIAQAFPGLPSGATANHSKSPDSSRFVFIIGLPRSGTTLLERILTGLANVRSNGETENFSRALLADLRGTGDIFQRAAAADPNVVAAHYSRFADPGASNDWVIEKLPMNYLYAGAIRKALPDAKLLWVRRSPIDCCFAMYRTLFGDAYPFSYDLNELARYYAAYAELMGHWQRVFGNGLYEVAYEELVRNPSSVGRSLSAYCGIQWNDAAIDIQNNRSVSLTASAAQVRRPIYGTSSGRWRHYQAHLQGLINTLRSCDIPDSTAD